MYRNLIVTVCGVLMVLIVFETHPVFAITKQSTLKIQMATALKSKTPVTKSTPTVNYTDDYISTLATNIFDKLLEQKLPSTALSALVKFSSQLSYNPNIVGLQPIYLPGGTDGSNTYFSATNLSSSSFVSDTASINTDMTIQGTQEVQGTTTLAKTFVSTMEIGSPSQPTGITIYDRTTHFPVCIFSDNTVMEITAGACLN